MNAITFTAEELLDIYDSFGSFNIEIFRNPLYERDLIGSFQDYIIRNYEGNILSVLEHELSTGAVPVGKTSTVVPNPDEIHLDCGHIERIYFSRKSRTEIILDVIVKARINLSCCDGTTANKALYKKAHLSQMYRMKATARLSQDDVFLVFHEKSTIYKQKTLPQPMSEYLVPYIRKEELEEYATSIINEYYPEAIRNAVPVSGTQLASRLGLKIEYHRLSEDHSIMGQLFFEDSYIPDYDGSNIRIAGHTIVIDPVACKKWNDNNTNLILLHECVHFILHSSFFYLQHLYNSEIHYLCCSPADAAGFGSDSPLYWIEWQADQIAYRLQLPINPLMRELGKLRNLENQETAISTAQRLEAYTSKLASAYGVSKNSAKRRLLGIGHKGMDGVLNFVDGKYITPYSYKESSLGKNQTFTISFAQLLQLCRENISFQKLITGGRYIFVENHLCLNNEKYICTDGTSASLTDYARAHMDECCLIFTKSYGQVTYHYREGSFLKEATRPGVVITFDGKADFEKQANQEDPMTAALRIANMIMEMPRTFNDTLKYHMKRLDWTNEKLAEECRISERTVTRLLSQPIPKSSLETIIALCMGMHLDPQISRDLITKSYIPMPPTVECTLYNIMIETMYLAGVDACNEVLERSGFKPLANAA